MERRRKLRIKQNNDKDREKDKSLINIYTYKKYFKFCQEVVILGGLLTKYNDFSYGKNRFEGLIEFCKKSIHYTENIEAARFLVLPFKFRGTDCEIFKQMNELSKKHNKKLLCFLMEDNHIPYNIESNVILFRPDIIRSFKLENERSFPMIRNDFFRSILKNPKLSISFVGNNNNNRERYLNYLEKSHIETHFIRRNGWWGGTDRSNMKKVHEDYYNNMNNSLFSFCHRGGGNYSYRFYEILMMGRIPLFINTECVIPFEEDVDINEIALVIDEKELTEDKKFHCKGSGKNNDLVYDKNLDYIDKLIPLIEDYYNKNKDRLEEIQINNRRIWEKYYSAVGFVSTILEKYHN